MDPKLLKGVNTDLYGDGFPFGDPAWYQANNTPYYNETHRKIRQQCRDFTEEHIMPFCMDWDEAGEVPREVYQEFAKTSLMPLVLGRPWPEKYIGKCPLGYEPDYFHELIVFDELARCGSGGVMWGIAGGMTIGLPPVYHFGSEALNKKVTANVLNGKEIICLAITEPHAGSDVAALRCSAELKGDHYVLNGEKKWITNGVFADYFTVACRTGDKGMGGISLLLVEKTMPGVTTKKMKCSGVWCSGTTYITFDDVKVPVTNLIGKENKGFKYAMNNFNHERFALCCMTNRFSRVCLEEALKFSSKRKTFGKLLKDHPVIRWKLAEMARLVESTHAWIEQVAYQMNTMTKLEATYKLGGPTALLKVQCTKVFEYCAREAAQVFGGLGYTRGGQGEKVERLSREVRAMAVPGGSEEIMLDLGIKQQTKIAEMGKALLDQVNDMKEAENAKKEPKAKL